jgi:hypothetical protein
MTLLSKVKHDITNVTTVYHGLGLTASVFSFFQGRATAFAIFFAFEGAILIGVGTWEFIHGHDLTSLAAFIQSIAMLDGAIFTGVVGHSLKEDYFQMRQQQQAVSVSPAPTQVSSAAPTQVNSATPEGQ